MRKMRKMRKITKTGKPKMKACFRGSELKVNGGGKGMTCCGQSFRGSELKVNGGVNGMSCRGHDLRVTGISNRNWKFLSKIAKEYVRETEKEGTALENRTCIKHAE